MPFTFPHRDITPCCDHDIVQNCTPVADLSKCMWPTGLSRAAVACAGSLSAQAPYISRSIDFRASPSLGSKCLLARSVPRFTCYTSSCRAMGKPDDPSQAFHGGQAKARSALDEMSTKGEFKRTDSTYRDHVKIGTRFEPEGKLGTAQASAKGSKQCWSKYSAVTCMRCMLSCPQSLRVSDLHAVAAAGRYHLYIAYACPWASRCLAVRNLKVSRQDHSAHILLLEPAICVFGSSHRTGAQCTSSLFQIAYLSSMNFVNKTSAPMISTLAPVHTCSARHLMCPCQI